MQFGSHPEPKEKRPVRDFLHQFVVGILAVLVAVHLVPGIQYAKPVHLILATLVLSALNAFLRPLLLLGCLPLLILTLGLFLIIINAGLLMLTGELVDGFTVKWFWPAFWGALIISIVTLIANTLSGGGQSQLRFRRGKPREKQFGYDRNDDDGPVIDV